jgi:hypothetical protein
MDIDIIDIIDTTKPAKTATSPKTTTTTTPSSKAVFKYVRPYIAPETLPKGINDDDYIVEDKFLDLSTKNFNPSSKQAITHNTLLVNQDYETDAKYLIKTYEQFEQNKRTKTKDFGYICGVIEHIIENPVLWFKDNNNVDEMTWIISRNIPRNTTSSHTIKNCKTNQYLAPSGSNIKEDATAFDWKITDKSGIKYIHTDITGVDLYLTYHPDKYRFPDSLTLEPLDNTKKQQWLIEQDQKTFKRETLDKVLKYSNGDYLKQIMDTIPPMQRFEFYKKIQNDLPPNQRLPETMLFLRSLTNNYMRNTGNYIDPFNAVQYVSRYISEMAEKIRGEKKAKYILGGSLLKNMYEDEMNKNPSQNKKIALQKCVNIIMDNK